MAQMEQLTEDKQSPWELKGNWKEKSAQYSSHFCLYTVFSCKFNRFLQMLRC